MANRERLSPCENVRVNKYTDAVIANWQALESRKANRFVTINYEEIEKFASKNALKDFEIPQWRMPGVYPENNLVFASYQLVTGSQNFMFNIEGRSGEEYAVENPDASLPPHTGSWAMDKKFLDKFGEKVITSDDLKPFFVNEDSVKDFYHGVNDIPCIDLRLKTMRDLIAGLDKYYKGDSLEVIKAATIFNKEENTRALRAFNNGNGLVERLIKHFPVAFGADTQELDGLSFPFAKRAQLVPLVIHGRALSSQGEIPVVEDIANIGPIVDYQIPRTLRFLKILEYSPQLKRKVDNWVTIPKDSREEVEIRAAAGTATQKLLDTMNDNRERNNMEPITITNLDAFLWFSGIEDKTSYSHVTPTSAY